MKKTQSDPQLRREIIAIILFTFSLGIVLSLISYDPHDPSFSFYDTNATKINNLLGIVGSYLADMMLQVFGLGSFLFVLVLFLCSLRLFFTLRFPLKIRESLGWLGLAVSVGGILSLAFGVFTLREFSGNAGGLLGYIISDFLVHYLNKIGAYILLVLIFILSLMAATTFSLLRTGSLFVATGSALKAWFQTLVKSRKKLHPKAIKKKQEVLAASSQQNAPLTLPPVTEAQPAAQEPAIITGPEGVKSFLSEEVRASKPQGLLSSDFDIPPLTLLPDPQKEVTPIERDTLIENSRLLENKLRDFGIQASVTNVHPGPVVTMYELEPAPGVKINRIVNLADDLALALRAVGIRIIAPLPGKGAIGVEIPNRKREIVYFKDIIAQEAFSQSPSPLTVGLGKDIAGMPIITDLAKMPHLLIAGTTGSGKSVFINTMICSILFKALPSVVKLLIMDPKRSELIFYNEIPHLLYPVVTDAKEAAEALRWAVEEMERRYHLLATMGTRDITSYNQKVFSAQREQDFVEPHNNGFDEAAASQPMPWIVIVIDELANLMMVASREVEWSLARLAQMARAAGIHLLVATQRPSVDVITGTIKANFPARISFRLTSKTDSRVIIDANGAENLLNQGDMLFLSPRTAKLKRIHGAYIGDDDILTIVNFLKNQAQPEYRELRLGVPEESAAESTGDVDEKYQEAVELVTGLGQASISLVQRKLRIGYNRAARIIEKMEEDGIVGPSDGVKPREVIRKMVDI